MSKIVGIDLGTTNSVVAVMEAGQPKVIPSAEGRNTVPSVVDPTKNLVGEIAKRQLLVAPKETAHSVKRLMGLRYSDPETVKQKKYMSFEVVEGKDGMVAIEVEGRQYTPQEISAKILQKLKTDAEAFLGEKVTTAVITVPAYFDDAQRQATKQAGEIAGLEVKRIINEPTAAALAYGLEKKTNELIAVYDLGGGTFDISLLEVGDGVFEVKATAGDTHLGGDDFDQCLMDYLANEFKKEYGIDVRQDSQALQRLRDAAEKAKIELSTKMETEVNIPFITADQGGPKHLLYKITRAKLEQLVDDLIDQTFKACEQVVKDAKVEPKDIKEVILVGGQTRMPAVQQHVRDFFGKEPHKGVNPDEVVAIGAAIQAAVLGGEVKDVLLLDVTPLTLGIETLGGVMTALIDRNTTIPTSKTQIFSTAADSQTSVEIHILQGERPLVADNKTLGRFILSGIPPAPRGVPQIEVTFDIDANGILNVSAKDKATGKEQKITIQASTALSKEEVEKMKQAARMHEEEDRSKHKQIEARNLADTLCYTAEKMLRESGDKLKSEDKSEIEKKMQALRGMLETASTEELKTKTEELSQLLQKIGAQLYQQTDQTPPPDKQKQDSTGEQQKDEERVQEGEIIDDDKEDKKSKKE